MESEMIGAIMIFLFCIFMIVLVSVIGIVVFIEKRLSYSSWFRWILAVVAGVGATITGFFITESVVVEFIGRVFFKDYVLMYSWVTDELLLAYIGAKPNFSLTYSLTYPLITVLGINMSILGGYIGGKIARRDENMYGFLVGLGTISVYVYASFIGFNNTFFLSSPFHKLYLVVIYPARFLVAALAGSYFALRQRKRNQANYPFENTIKYDNA